MISDDRAEMAVEFYRDNANKKGQLRGAVAAAEHRMKITLAQKFLQSTGTVAERDAMARSSSEYAAQVEELENLTAELHTLDTYLKAAEYTIEIWRTQQANSRRAHV